jgi:hypothetical protein
MMDKDNLGKKLRRAARKGKIEEIGKLLDAGADIETRGGFFSLGQGPLACAVYSGHIEAAKYLLDRGANPEAKDETGDTVLWLAISSKNVDMVKLLLDHGANPQGRCDMHERYTPIELAQHNKDEDMVRLLREAIAATIGRERDAFEKRQREIAAREKQEKEAERAKDRDIVMVFSALGDRTLQEIYNFSSLERFTLVRKGEDGPVEAVTRQDFADIGDKPGLRAAFAEHQRRGGTASEKSVFPGSLQKIKPLLKDTP